MKYKGKKTIREVPIIELLDEKSLERLNSLFGTFYRNNPKDTRKLITIRRKEKSFDWWNRLVRGKPGFDRGDYEPK
jgi:hypothetical protein